MEVQHIDHAVVLNRKFNEYVAAFGWLGLKTPAYWLIACRGPYDSRGGLEDGRIATGKIHVVTVLRDISARW